jgi:hypothetical protein
MFKLFDIVGDRITIKPEALGVPEFRTLWERDDTKNKDRAMKELSYIVFYNDPRSPYQSYSDENKEFILKKDFIKDPSWLKDNEFLSAVKKFCG